MAFTLQSSGGGKLKADELPHQVVVLLADAQDPLRTVSTIVTVKPSTGKASWNQASTDWYAICIALIAYLFFPTLLLLSVQRIDRLPSILTRGSNELQATLLIASFGDTKTIKLPLLKIQVPAVISEGKGTTRDSQEVQQGFQRHLERRHTFNTPAAEQMPPKPVSLIAAAATLLLPSTVLLILVSRLL